MSFVVVVVGAWCRKDGIFCPRLPGAVDLTIRNMDGLPGAWAWVWACTAVVAAVPVSVAVAVAVLVVAVVLVAAPCDRNSGP